MLRYLVNIGVLLAFVVVATAASAGTPIGPLAAAPGSAAAEPAQKTIYKVKPCPDKVYKIKPAEPLAGISRFSPLAWGIDCCYPSHTQGQFSADATVLFARLRGSVSKAGYMFAGTQPEKVDFTDHLKLGGGGKPMFTVSAMYQFQPRWAIRYSFSPVSMEATGSPDHSFTFRGQTFTSGTNIRSKWERMEHRAGLVFNVNKTVNSVASIYADWMYIQDRLSISQVGGGAFPTVQFDDDKSLAVVGIEIDKCLTNLRGTTLALSCKGGVAFLGDQFGYEAEAGLKYLVPVRHGSFGYIKGGYRYATLKKDVHFESFSTTMDGAFIQAGFFL